ncbi:hypothetical protein INR49_029747, partial [Caranx melampygus]
RGQDLTPSLCLQEDTHRAAPASAEPSSCADRLEHHCVCVSACVYACTGLTGCLSQLHHTTNRVTEEAFDSSLSPSAIFSRLKAGRAQTSQVPGQTKQVMAITGGTVETLDEIPGHVWKGLPDTLSLRPSAINQNRIGVWATQIIPKGKRFGPFVGEKKKRSQVTSNVYMWEPIGPGEELLVWYTVKDNPEITAALEEERASSLSRKNSTRAKRGLKEEENERPPAMETSQELEETHPMGSADHKDIQYTSAGLMDRGNGGEERRKRRKMKRKRRRMQMI